MNIDLSKYLLISLLLLLTSSLHAQRVIGELESNTDMDMLPEAGEDSGKKDKTIVPADVRSWSLDPIFGNRYDTYVDTLHHQFQNADRSEGMNGHNNTLANLGSPRLSRIYMERLESNSHSFIFANAFDQFLVPSDKFRYFNTKSPYMNLTYNWCGSKQTGYDHFRALYTQNAGKRFNFGGIYDYMYGQGFYDNQSTSFMNATAFASYIGDRYDMHFHYTHNYMKLGENGGIEDEVYITNPEDLTQTYGSKDIPTRLSSTLSRQEHDVFFLNHRYHVGFTRPEGDSTDLHDVFVPVTSFFHTFSYAKYRRSYQAYATPQYYHSYTYLVNDTTNDRVRMNEMLNLVGVSLREGFNKYAVAGLNAYIGFRHDDYELPDTVRSAGVTRQVRSKYSEDDILVGGQLIRTKGSLLHYNVQAQFDVAGDNAGELSVDGHAELNFLLLGDTAQVAVNGLLEHSLPDFHHEHFHSTHAWWDQSLGNIIRTRLQGVITLPHTNTELTVGLENIKNYTYFANDGIVIQDLLLNSYQTNNVCVRQCSDNIQIFSASLQQKLKLGILHWDNDFTYQTTSNQDVLPLPKLNLYSNLYLAFRIAKVLSCEVGADVLYFTEYTAPDYSPVVSQFVTQNPNKIVKIGNYPLVSAYANFLLKRCRFYIQYYHLNQSTGRYFWAPYYPMNPAGLHMGISWNFYD